MKHYEIGEWADYIRNLVSEEMRIEMQQHREICSDCGALCDLLNKVAEAAQVEQAYDSATSDLSAAARDAFVQHPSYNATRDRVVRALQTLVAHLTYDSAADLRPAGARSQHSANRQMLYEAGDYCIDLRFDSKPDSKRVAVVGQVANRQRPEYPAKGLPVVVQSQINVVAQALSNEFGEFSLEYSPRRDLRLLVSIADAGVRLEVPLKGLSDD